MKAIRVVTVLVLACGAIGSVAAGEIYGKVTSGAAAVGEGVPIVARCGEKSYPAVKTDKSGNYHLTVQETGKCVLTVEFQGQKAALDAVSYDEPAQVDVVLETKDGKLQARRK